MNAAMIEGLHQRSAHFEVMHHRPSYTAIQEAVSLGLPAARLMKPILLDSANGHLLAVIPGNRHLDLRRVRALLEDRTVHLATEFEIERDFPQYELGALPPLGSMLGIPLIVDPEVMAQTSAVFAASHHESVRGSLAEMFDGEEVTLARITRDGSWVVAP